MAMMEEYQIEKEGETEEKTITTIMATMSRKEKRKAIKKIKRKQLRKEIALKEKEEEEARKNDPEEQMRLLRLEQEEADRMAKDRFEFEERERQFIQALELEKKRKGEEEERRKVLEEESQCELVNGENANEVNEDDGWEYIEEGPAEIIWKGNEIIVKKKKVRVPKKVPDAHIEKQETEGPISNPLAPQSEVFEDFKSAQEALESVAQQVPNFGTEQDKSHCPFHLKTGVCRFGARCSRVHFYPDKSCTLLIKSMYNGPGITWEQDEGLEHTDEEVERSFEDFYEDVHTEFLKFGELVNFKVCKNGSSHLRGNVYVHYKSLESAVLAYQSINGRYFAGKLLTCEYINVTRWKVAICGEYMKSRLKTCSRGSACNFIHCFQNPGGDYEWADWDKPAPRYWLKKMAALFGYMGGNRSKDEICPRYHSRRSRSRGLDSPHRKSFSDEDDGHKRRRDRHSPHRGDSRGTSYRDREAQKEKGTYQDHHCFRHRETDGDDVSEESAGQRSVASIKKNSRKRERLPESTKQDNKSRKVEAKDEYAEEGASDRYVNHKSRSSSRQNSVAESDHERRLNKIDKFDQGKSPYAVEHLAKFHRYKDKRVPHNKNEADFLNFDSHKDSQDSMEDGYHGRKKDLRRKKDETESSSSVSDESRLDKVESRHQKKRRNSSRLKDKTSAAEIGCNGDSRESYEDRQHKHYKQSTREAKNSLETADGGDRLLNRDDKSSQKKSRKSSRVKHQSGFTDAGSDRDEDRRHKYSEQRSKHVKNDVESSDNAFDGDKHARYEKRSQKSRRNSSRSKKEPDLADANNRERIDEKERQCGHRSDKHHIKESDLSKVDSTAYMLPGEANAGNLIDDKFRDTSYKALAERDLKRCDEEHILQVNKCDEKATESEKVETSLLHTSCDGIDDEAKVELEKACRHAALNKLEEIRMRKDAQGARSSESIESLRLCTHENILSGVMEKSDSSKSLASDAAIRRRI